MQSFADVGHNYWCGGGDYNDEYWIREQGEYLQGVADDGYEFVDDLLWGRYEGRRVLGF